MVFGGVSYVKKQTAEAVCQNRLKPSCFVM